jgi:drug/metabolite transporter (DMT)-like permease
LATEGPAAATRLTTADLGAIGYLALLVTVAAFLLWYSTVAAVGPGRVGLLTGIAPVAAALTGIAIGSRTPGLLMWIGTGVVLSGLAGGLWTRQTPSTGLPGPVDCAGAAADASLG